MNKQKGSFGRLIVLLLQGALIGSGAILPGISGGVLCVAFGLYEPLLALLAHPIRCIREQYRTLVPVLIGVVGGFVLLAKLVEAFLAASEMAAMMLFIGLICGTVPGLFRKAVDQNPKSGWGSFIIVLVASYIFFNILKTGFTASITPNFGWFVFCGVIWGLSMIVPGLSSSSILLFMGLYQPMTQGIGDMNFAVILPLLIGYLATVFSLSHVMDKLLKTCPALISRVILGFVISSTLMIVPVSFAGVGQILLSILCFAAGFAVAYAMDRSKEKIPE